MTQEVRIDRDGVREVARALRAAHARWMETLARAQRARQALAAAVQAAPGRTFEAAAAQTAHRLQQGGERLLRLAETLEKALQRLEEAFAEATRAVEEGWIAPPLPTTPLAVDGSGEPLPNQFVFRFRADGVDLPWNAGCGPMALSMALSRLKGRPIPAQAVADRLVRENRLGERLEQERQEKGHLPSTVSYYTNDAHLRKTAQAYGVEGQRVYLDGSSSEAAWAALRDQIIRTRTAVIALVTAKSQTTNWTDSWQGADGRPAEAIVLTEKKQTGDGGILTGHALPQAGETAHWVVVDRLEERDGERYVVVNNPFYNRQERYPWAHFWSSVNHQAREGNRWWVLALEVPPETPKGSGATPPRHIPR
jgi:hypothetical protein